MTAGPGLPTPTCTWSQSADSLTITLAGAALASSSLNVSVGRPKNAPHRCRQALLVTAGEDKLHVLDLPLSQEISTGQDPLWSRARGDAIRVTLTKAESGHWKQLTGFAKDPGYVKVDWSSFNGNDDEGDDPDDDYDAYLRSRYGVTSEWGGPMSGDQPPVLGGRTPGKQFEDHELEAAENQIPLNFAPKGELYPGEQQDSWEPPEGHEMRLGQPLKPSEKRFGQLDLSTSPTVETSDGKKIDIDELNLEDDDEDDEQDKTEKRELRKLRQESQELRQKRNSRIGLMQKLQHWMVIAIRALEALLWMVPCFSAAGDALFGGDGFPMEHSAYPLMAMLVTSMGLFDALTALFGFGCEGPGIATLACWLKRSFISTTFLVYEAQFAHPQGGLGLKSATGCLMLLAWTSRKVSSCSHDISLCWRAVWPPTTSATGRRWHWILFFVEAVAEACFLYVHATRLPSGTRFLGSERGEGVIGKASLLCVFTGNAVAFFSLTNAWAQPAAAPKAGASNKGAASMPKRHTQSAAQGDPEAAVKRGFLNKPRKSNKTD